MRSCASLRRGGQDVGGADRVEHAGGGGAVQERGCLEQAEEEVARRGHAVDLDLDIVKLVDESLLIKHRILPILQRGKRLFVADHKLGLLSFDIATGKMSVVLNRPHHEGFKGLNDLTFASNGDLYFTDQGQSALEDPTGRVFRLRATGELDLLFKGFAGPNGLVLSKDEKILYVAETRRNRINSLPLLPDYEGVSKCGIFIQLSGSPTGPDGMALDEEGNLAIVHAGFGTVWIFSRLGEPLFRIKSCAGMRTTNLAYGGPDRKTLYITEAEHGVILKAQLPVAGKLLYSHL